MRLSGRQRHLAAISKRQKADKAESKKEPTETPPENEVIEPVPSIIEDNSVTIELADSED